MIYVTETHSPSSFTFGNMNSFSKLNAIFLNHTELVVLVDEHVASDRRSVIRMSLLARVPVK